MSEQPDTFPRSKPHSASLERGQWSAKEHADESRLWAEAADREAVKGDEAVAHTYAAVSTAHSLAAIATALCQESISGPAAAQPDAPLKPDPSSTQPPLGIPAVGVLDRDMVVVYAGHPEHVAPPVGLTEGEEGRIAGVVSDDLMRVNLPKATVQLHREQLRLPSRFAAREVPVVPAPGTPAHGVLTENQRVLLVHTGGHAWPDILRTVGGAPYEAVAGRVVEVNPFTDLVKVVCDKPGTGVGGAGPTVLVHREQTRIPAPESVTS